MVSKGRCEKGRPDYCGIETFPWARTEPADRTREKGRPDYCGIETSPAGLPVWGVPRVKKADRIIAQGNRMTYTYKIHGLDFGPFRARETGPSMPYTSSTSRGMKA